MLIGIVSIGGSPLAYGNVYDGSWRFGNFVAEYLCEYLRNSTNDKVDMIYYQEKDDIAIMSNTFNKYDILFFALDFVNYSIIKNYVNYLKKEKIVSVLFGHLISNYYIDVINEINVDYCIIGDSEEPAKKILNCILKKIDFSNDISIVSKDNYLNKQKNICSDVNRKKCFDYYINDSYENNIEKTHCISLKNQVCQYNCSFCWSNKGKYIFKDINNIIEEIKYVALTFKIKDFYFTDNDILDYRNQNEYDYIKKLFEEITKLNLKLSIFVFSKSKNINEKNIPILEKMKKAGVYCIFIGIDGGNNDDLRLYRKASNLEQGYNAIQILNNLNIWYRVGLIAINPYSTLFTLKENYKFLCKIHCSNYFQYCGMKVMLFKGTPLYYKVKNDLLLEDNYSIKTFYGYKFKNTNILKYLKFTEQLLKTISSKNFIPFFALRKQYEKTKTISNINDDNLIDNIEKELFDTVSNYFKLLFEDNNIDLAKHYEEKFINKICTICSNNENLLKKYKKLYNSIMN